MDTGGKIRTGNILRELAKSHDITLVSNYDPQINISYLDEISKFCTRFVGVPRRHVQKHSAKFLLRLIPQTFSKYPVSALNDYSTPLRRTLECEANSGNYDLAICDFVQSALLFKNLKDIPKLLFQHNVESVILERHHKRASSVIAHIFWKLQWKRMKQYEGSCCKNFQVVVAVSENDKKLMESIYGLNNVVSIPTGVDINYFQPFSETKEDPRNLVFCGSMDWLPNQDAVEFFISEVLPKIQRRVPRTTFTVVGRNPSQALKRLVANIKGVQLTGWVEDTRPYLARSAVSVVPIRIGGGTRMKIFEAMAMAKPVVSTSIGAEGLPIKPREHILIEDDPIAMAKAITELLLNPIERRKLGDRARNFVVKHFAWPRVAESFEKACNLAIERWRLQK